METQFTEHEKAERVIDSLQSVYDKLMLSAPLDEMLAGTADAYKNTADTIRAAVAEGKTELEATNTACDFAVKEYLRIRNLPRSMYHHMLRTGYHDAHEFLCEVLDYWED